MKTLYLLRHAKSSWANPGLIDLDRPLNERGNKDAPRMGLWLKNQVSPPQRILTSHAHRALATISKLGHAMGFSSEDYHTDTRLYHASPRSLWELLHNSPEEVNSLMLVGHNPGLTSFANQLCPVHAIDNIPTCGVYALQFHCSQWEKASPGNAEFLFFQYPKNL